MKIKSVRSLAILVLLTTATFWIVTIFTIATSAMPYNSTSKQLYNKKNNFFRAFLPEGFAFFTRSPRKPLIILVSKKNRQEIELHNGVPKYFFGFRRHPRAANLEISVIWTTVNDQVWYNCESGSQDCFDDDLTPHYLINSSFHKPLISGDYYMKVVKPIPWAWANSFKKSRKYMPCKVISITINSISDDR